MDEDLINYGALIDDAMHVIVQKALERVAEKGLPGSHHFFISFLTHYPGVVISEKLRKRYPEEMTIVLQYQFDELEITDKKFSVQLSFDGVKERIVVPFMALTAFADPSVKFGLQFRHLENLLTEEEGGGEVKEFVSPEEITEKPASSSEKGKTTRKSPTNQTNVITLDAFRKTPPKNKK